MKRIKQLQPLSKEHHASLSLGQKAILVSHRGDAQAIKELCLEIVLNYPKDWQVHFKVEEDSIFTPYQDRVPELYRLCQQLYAEHRRLHHYYQQMADGDCSVLGDFGKLLKQHTRMEERQLFPLLTELLNQQELDKIYQSSVAYR